VADLDVALRDLAAHVAFPEPPDVAAAVGARLRSAHATERTRLRSGWSPSTTRRLLAVAAAVLLVLVIVAAAVPRTRHAVADRLGLRGVEVRVVPTTTPGTGAPTGPSTAPASVAVPAGVVIGRPTTLAEAAAGFDGTLLVPPDAPTGVFVDDRTGEVNLTFGDGRLLGQFPNAVPLFEKLLDPAAETTAVTVDGGRGLWIAGPAHVFVELGERGTEARSRLAGPTLIWEHGDTTLRLEGVPTLDEALAVATSLRPFG
jgi:hypothetical protein